MKTPLAAIVLCAGKGTRMKSERAKVLHAVLGKPLCYYPVQRALELGASHIVAVVGHQGEDVSRTLAALFPHAALRFATQTEQRGTGDAVRSAERALEGFSGAVMILYGDTPLLTQETLAALVEAYETSKGPLALVTTRLEDPSGYGRVVREGGRVRRVVEHKDASVAELAVQEVNAGVYIVESRFLWEALAAVTSTNAQGEFYLTDLVEKAAGRGELGVVQADARETAGVNDRVDLAGCARVLQQRINLRHMKAGVTLQDPATTYIDEDVTVDPDTELGPNVSLQAGTHVGSDVFIGQGSVLTASDISDGTLIRPYSLFENAKVGKGCQVGPFSRLRPGSVLDEGVHLGNFVETKKTRIGKGSKASHLSYLGDATIGAGVNIGAGTITCNYDGVNKFGTVIEDGVFIGSDTQLVAPVTVHQGSYVGAGTTVTRDVPAMSLSLSRAPQVIKEGWVARKKQKEPVKP